MVTPPHDRFLEKKTTLFPPWWETVSFFALSAGIAESVIIDRSL